MQADELREIYLSFFESKGHTRYPSDSLVPRNDPTLLFTGAGMNQFKEMFLGVGNLPFSRATTAQKCFRTGDLDSVGRTDYHHTFFEMLGNFSFGDYFKREAIQWAWEFVVERLGLPVDRLWVSVFEEDDEAYAIWHEEVGFPRDRIWRLGAGDNYWPANAPAKGPNGPCGPCSEIFFDYGSPGEEGDPEAARYCEIWNLVFTQFNRVGLNQLEPLAQRNIDTGLGFERVLAVLNGKRSNFETALFQPLIQATASLAGLRYGESGPRDTLLRRIADHARAGTFLVADGVKPSNEGRGYVVRRVLRRAIRDGIALGIEQPFLHGLVPIVVETMGRAYPELVTARAAATAFLRAEEEKFRSTFETGMALLERAVASLPGKVLPGETAFVLYDTHGFPLELCEEILAEQGLRVDREGFDRCMERQRARSRAGSTIVDEVFVATAVTAIKRDLEPTEFLGYGAEESEAEVVAMLHGDRPVESAGSGEGEIGVITAATPFYAEAGGQVGDAGRIESPRSRFRVVDTRRLEDYVVHYGHVEEGVLERGERVALRVDHERRGDIRRNHSATHLLHAALRAVLGTHVTQAGSLVAPDRLRFDFTHPRAVTAEELRAIELWVNSEVLRNSEVRTELMELEKARASGAMALFGEKYDPMVRVVRIGEHSVELCGGTHVGRSAEIGACLLSQETSVAAGVRRIEMLTGSGALRLAQAQRQTLRVLAETLRAPPEAVPQRVEALVQDLRGLKRQVEQQGREGGAVLLDGLVADAVSCGGVAVVVGSLEGDDPALLRSLSDGLRARLGETVTLLAGRGSGGVTLVATAGERANEVGIRAGDLLREFAQTLGGKGGGRPRMAQGRLPSTEGLEAALRAARERLVGALASR